MKKKETQVPSRGMSTQRENDRNRPHFYGDYYDRYGQRRNSTCRGCPFDGQCTTCLED